MEELTYNYDLKKPNRLLRVDDAEGDVPDADDLGDQEKGNYQYNSIGQLTKDVSEGISYIYTASGLVAEVLKNGEPLVKFFYNDRNHRVKKEHYAPNNFLFATTYYVRDVAGQVMAVYNDVGGDPALEEQPVYGAGRIGIAYNGNNNEKTYVYELTDHLGNVRAVFTKNNDDANLEGYTDYYPFGMPMPNRTLLGPEGYRYAFQGQEKDPETGKEAFELRLWDGRIGRWLTTDPMGEFASPYLGMGNNPMNLIDPSGGMTDCSCKDKSNNSFFNLFMLNTINPLDDFIFDENGNYLRTEITGSPDRLVIENSQTGFRQNYSFADPINDPKDIKYGDITNLVFVSKLDIIKILGASGAFDKKNGSYWRFYQKSKGGGDFDFSYEGIPDYFGSYPGVSSLPQYKASKVLFVIQGEHTVHNHMNFGNFLWGAAGATLGFDYSSLQFGAHANSLLNSGTNNYPSQWDSADDQISIILGAFYARQNRFGN